MLPKIDSSLSFEPNDVGAGGFARDMARTEDGVRRDASLRGKDLPDQRFLNLEKASQDNRHCSATCSVTTKACRPERRLSKCTNRLMQDLPSGL